ncbi:isocitrate/isopropylmalate dehydrogenase family protein [Acuticoccus mangrovi]|uniref:Isocitrate/isopropylmalate dehydrogenase family protein n=1 Tax=Acuticoccus mangrovi TaxID=2796142 RepID=A0A934ILQ0_9HYPH|nr:isocitrate/isopropylmalate family dehydrogenase [Acuticoccus mangrovi]MBJ3774562.1 isocitrate/isopropylmalate dehydrogenase family protein [Acuticoccus mangrovi]
MDLSLAVLSGDGIGPEITAATLHVVAAAERRFGLGLRLSEHPVGVAALAATGSTFPAETAAAIKAADGVILAPVDTYAYPAGQPNPSAIVRKSLDLFANIRPAVARLPAARRRAEIDLVMYRENTEGFYADRNMFDGSAEFLATEDVALAVRKITREASTRIAREAFRAAARRRGLVTAVHKANVLKRSDGLFLEAVRAVASEFPEVRLEEVIVDAMAAHLVRDAARFDVVVTTNMFGDILSDEAGELAGGLGLAPALNAGSDHAVAQAVHGSAPDIAGEGIANPAALILSAALLLRWLGERHATSALVDAAGAIEGAVDAALADPAAHTRDLGGTATTMVFAERVANALKD